MSQKIILFIAAYFVWCLFTWVPDVEHLVVGIFVALIVTLLMGDMVILSPFLMLHPQRCVYFLCVYVPVFLWEMVKANVDMAYRVIHPRLPISPGIVKVKTSLSSDIAITLLANSITLTPGTMSVDVDKEQSVLYIHWIDVRSYDTEVATRVIVERFEGILRKVFAEEADNGKD